MRSLDKALLLTFATLLAFVVVVLVYNYQDKQVQSELITGFIAIIAAELTTCGGITIFKNRKPKSKNKKDGGVK